MRIFTRIALILLGFAAFTTAKAQQDIHVVGGQFFVSGPVTTNRLEADLYVENRNINDLAVLVDRDISQMHPAHRAYYCWAQCYDTTVGLSPESLVLPGLTVDSTSFHSYMYTFNTAGTSIVTYTFFDQNNPSDTSVAVIHYDVLNTGISGVERSLYSLSAPSPNPSNNMTSFTYAAPVNNAKLIVRDMIGNIVAEYQLNTTKGMIFVPTSELNSGIYLCSIVSNGSSISSSKLVVSHR